MNADQKRRHSQILSSFIQQNGFTIYGFGYVGDVLQQFPDLNPFVVENLHYAVCIGISLSVAIIDEIEDHPTKTYFFHYRRTNIALDDIGVKISDKIQSLGYNAFPVPSSFITDWENQRGHISHKAVAIRCGLGWIGRNNLLVHPTYGSRVRYISVLTDMPLPQGEILKHDCGTCRACVSVCPAGAIGDDVTQFDRWACFEKLKVFSKKYNIGHYICGVCVKACEGRTAAID